MDPVFPFWRRFWTSRSRPEPAGDRSFAQRIRIALVWTVLLMVPALLLGGSSDSGRLVCLPGIVLTKFWPAAVEANDLSATIREALRLPRGEASTPEIMVVSAVCWVIGIAWLLKCGRWQRVVIAGLAGWFGLSVLFLWQPVCVYRGPSSNACINSLRQIDGAKQQWALENRQRADAVPTWEDLIPYLGRGMTVPMVCPSGGTYSLGAVNVPPTCSLPGPTPGRKERVGLLGYRWSVWPSAGRRAHRLE
jgi:hypothetical protein